MKIFSALKRFEKGQWVTVGAGTLRVIEVTAIVWGVIFAAMQLHDVNKDQSAQMMLQFNSSLSEAQNSKIITAIENNSPVLIENGGQFTTTDLDRYLSVYDLLDEVSTSGLISDEMLYNGFSYDIIKTYNDQEIKAYLAKVRNGAHNNNLFGGYEELAKALIAVQD